MFSHIMLGANDIQQSKKFYDATLGVLGHKPGVIDEKGRCFYLTETGVFALTKPIDGQDASHGNGSTFGFLASCAEMVDKWHQSGLANGGIDCEDPPGERQGPNTSLYLAYLRDPSGNKICALHRVK